MAAQPRTQKTPSGGRPQCGKHLQMSGHNSNISTHSPECSPPCWLPNPHQADSQHYPCDPHHHFLLSLLLPLFLPSDSVSHRGLLDHTTSFCCPFVVPNPSRGSLRGPGSAQPAHLPSALHQRHSPFHSHRLYLNSLNIVNNVFLIRLHEVMCGSFRCLSNCRQQKPYFLDNLYLMHLLRFIFIIVY